MKTTQEVGIVPRERDTQVKSSITDTIFHLSPICLHCECLKRPCGQKFFEGALLDAQLVRICHATCFYYLPRVHFPFTACSCQIVRSIFRFLKNFENTWQADAQR